MVSLSDGEFSGVVDAQVYSGLWVDNGALIHMLRSVPERSDAGGVRGGTNVPNTKQVVGDYREVQSFHLLHSANSHPVAASARRRARTASLALVAARAGHRGGGDQRQSVAVVPQSGRGGPVPDRRHLVADGNRRDHDQSVAWRLGAEAWVRHAPVLRCAARGVGSAGERTGRTLLWISVH